MVRGGTPADVRGLKRKPRDYGDDDDDDEVVAVKRSAVNHRANGANSVERPLNPYANFRKGNLVRLHMQSFITFADTVMEPKPRLNLVCLATDLGVHLVEGDLRLCG
jgi:hypothetical protein